MNYTAPVDDLRFCLNHIAQLASVCSLPSYAHSSVELSDAILQEAARFAQKNWAPTNQAGDVGCQLSNHAVTTPAGFKQAWQDYVDAGWITLRAPEEFGGQGLPATVALATEEMWCSANLALSLAPLLTLGAIEALNHHASAQLKQKYLPNMCAGVWTGTMNLTEPGAGSDLAQIQTKAWQDEQGQYRIKGQKIYITWGEQDLTENIIHLVLARLPNAPAGVKGISLFVAPKFLVNEDGSLGARNDLKCVSIEHKLGIHGSPTAVMSYGDEEGAIAYLVGEENQGLAYMFTMMNHARLGVGVEGMAVAERAYQAASSYAKERIQSKSIEGSDTAVAIIEHPDVKRMLLTMKSSIEAQRALALYAAHSLDHAASNPNPQERALQQARLNFLIPIVKSWCTEEVNVLSSLAIQVYGGMGYIEETGVAQYYRDARITAIYEGCNGIQALDLVGRKTYADQGLIAKVFLDEMRSAQQSLAKLNELKLATRMTSHIEQLTIALNDVCQRMQAKKSEVAAGAHSYLMAWGYALGALMMAKSVISAHELLQDSDNDHDFLTRKIKTAHFYDTCHSIKVKMYVENYMEGAASVLAFAISDFV